jgi:hypothetical protein
MPKQKEGVKQVLTFQFPDHNPVKQFLNPGDPKITGACAKGRNGEFDPRSACIYESEITPGCTLEVYSRRSEGAPPIYLRLPKDEARQIALAMLEICGPEVDGGQPG